MNRPAALPLAPLCAAAATWSLGALAVASLCGFGPYRPAAAGTASLGQGDAQVASGVGAAALYANPAGMSQIQHMVVEAGFARQGHANTGGPFASYVDSTSSWGLAGGVGYSGEFGWGVDAPARSGHDVRIGLSAGGQSDNGRLMLGGSARYVDTRSGADAGVSGWTADFGTVVGLVDFRIGAVLRNAMNLDVRAAPRRVASGIAWVGQQAVVEAGGSWGVANAAAGPGLPVGQSYRVGGAAMFGAEGLQVRAGYQWDQIVSAAPTRHWLSAGVSWRTTKAGVDLGAAFDLGADKAAMVSISLIALVPHDADSP